MPRATPAADSDEAPLKRLGGGRWQTRDERFTIEPQSGTWAVVDAEQADDFGMALVRGPFGSLTEAKAAISSARTSAPATSPVSEKIEQRKSRLAAKEAAEPAPTTIRRRATAARDHDSTDDATDGAPAADRGAGRPARTRREEPVEPAWLTDLAPAERGRARRLIARLEEAGIGDAVSVVRRDVLGDVAAVAAIVLARRLEELGDDASPARVADLLADGRDDRLDVRWRLVDGEGRPIVLDLRSGDRRR